jgi:phage-related protein
MTSVNDELAKTFQNINNNYNSLKKEVETKLEEIKNVKKDLQLLKTKLDESFVTKKLLIESEQSIYHTISIANRTLTNSQSELASKLDELEKKNLIFYTQNSKKILKKPN